MKKKKNVGRPAVYTGKVKKHIVSLIRKHGLTGARRILNARTTATADDYEGNKADCEAAAEAERSHASFRSSNLIPEPLNISMPTLSKFANEAGVERKMGRPKAKAA